MHFISTIYRIEPSRLARIAAAKWFGRMWWIFALPLAVCAVLTFSDIRFLIVGLMVIFIIWPMALTMAWFWLCGTPSVIDNIRPAQVVVDDNGIVFAYNPECGDAASDTPKPAYSRYSWSDFDRTETERSLTLFYMKDSKRRFLAVPTNLLSDDVLQTIWLKIDEPNQAI